MTKLKTLITTILLGTSSMAAVASAQPAQGFYGESSSYSRTSPRDHRTGNQNDSRFERGPETGYAWSREDDYDARFAQPAPSFAALSDRVAASGDRQFINFTPGGVRAGAIQLELQRGRVYVYQIAVQFMNGRTQVQPVGRWMSAREDAIETVDLGGRHDVKRVIVYTANGERASYQLLGA